MREINYVLKDLRLDPKSDGTRCRYYTLPSPSHQRAPIFIEFVNLFMTQNYSSQCQESPSYHSVVPKFSKYGSEVVVFYILQKPQKCVKQLSSFVCNKIGLLKVKLRPVYNFQYVLEQGSPTSRPQPTSLQPGHGNVG